ncbi:SpoIIE family protein phosphatase [Saccharothrix sp. Mg75]|uniref:SpoIIE family protein phosphatase n=1 Tax=Saccharothrix sp. Mg75 TaxID=3445357 RepID=UPI003EEC9C59
MPTLSLWQSGRRRPERPGSLCALTELERVLELPGGSLSSPLGPPRPRSRGADGGVVRLSRHDRVEVDAGRRIVVAHSRAVLRAGAGGLDRWTARREPGPGPAPRVEARRNCRVGRVEHDFDSRTLTSEEDIDLLQLPADRPATAAHLHRSRSELATATLLQNSLLPGLLPTVPAWEFAARYVPGAENGVGGDWYDVFEPPDERIGVVIGDVVGSGVPAAIVMGRLRSALHAYALEFPDPAEVSDKLDRKAGHFEAHITATVAHAVIDTAAACVDLVLDLTEMELLASAGVALLIQAAVHAQRCGVAFVVAASQRVVLCPLQETRPDKVFTLRPDRDHTTAAVRGLPPPRQIHRHPM